MRDATMRGATRGMIPVCRARISRQWPIGDGGLRGVRRVKNDTVYWQNHIFAHPRLVPFDREWVFIEDFACPEITVSQCLWTAHYHNRTGHPYPGKVICEIKEAKNG